MKRFLQGLDQENTQLTCLEHTDITGSSPRVGLCHKSVEVWEEHKHVSRSPSRRVFAERRRGERRLSAPASAGTDARHRRRPAAAPS